MISNLWNYLFDWRNKVIYEKINVIPNKVYKYDQKNSTKESKITFIFFPETRQFELNVSEDEWDDWPYPHRMFYKVKGNLPPSTGDCQITDYVYTTQIQDDLDYTITKSIFNVKEHTTDSSDILMEHSFGINKYIIRVPSGFIYVRIEQMDERSLELHWRRFHPLWTTTQDGTDYLTKDGLEQTIYFKITNFSRM